MEEARKPVVTLQRWGGKKRTVQEASYQASCSAFPAVAVSHHVNTDAANEAVELTAEDLFKELGAQQTKSFKGATEADTELTIDTDDPDGNGKLEFKGVALGDIYGFSSTSVSIRGHAMPEWALMDMLNYSIYTDISVDTNEVIPEADSILDVIKLTEKRLVEGWEQVKSKLQEDQTPGGKVTLQSSERVHERNQKVRKYFLKILSNSSETFGWTSIDSIFTIKEQKEVLNNSIANVVMRVLVGGRGSFLPTLNALASQFQCIYVPGSEPDDPGKLVNMAYLVASDPEDLDLKTLVSTSMQAGNPGGLLPVGYVHVTSGLDGNTNVAHPYLGISVPKEAMDYGGAVERVALPNWCASNTVDMFRQEETTLLTKPEPGSASAQQLPGALTKLENTGEQLGYATNSLAAAWGLGHYAWVALAHCKATISVPGSFKYKLGTRYRVKCQDKELFTGYLYAINVNVSTSSCLTSLSFSHIMATGFKLPGLNEMKAAKLIH